jgi:hypothetical protein
MNRKIIVVLLIILMIVPLFLGCLGEDKPENEIPLVEIVYPHDGVVVSSLVMISGTAYDQDGEEDLVHIEVTINGVDWFIAEGTRKWSFDWRTYEVDDGLYNIWVRSYDGTSYSVIKEISLEVDNPDTIESGNHKWAIFIGAANFPEDNETKLGNGGLFLAEEISTFLIETSGYSTSNIFILFDDGWFRDKNGYGSRLNTLQERPHKYDITFGGATKQNVEASIKYIVEQSNKYDDSEVFIWIFGHGCGDQSNELTGGKISERSEIFLWDDTIKDKELGLLLSNLRSKKTCIIIDACYAGGFADKTILNLPTSFILRSDIPKSGRIVISGTSKYRVGYASTMHGPLFSIVWFEGLKTGDADGFRPGIAKIGRSTRLRLFRDGKTSVEEAFYYARYIFRTVSDLEKYKKIEPQINDQYPNRGFFRSLGQMHLGE